MDTFLYNLLNKKVIDLYGNQEGCITHSVVPDIYSMPLKEINNFQRNGVFLLVKYRFDFFTPNDYFILSSKSGILKVDTQAQILETPFLFHDFPNFIPMEGGTYVDVNTDFYNNQKIELYGYEVRL